MSCIAYRLPMCRLNEVRASFMQIGFLILKKLSDSTLQWTLDVTKGQGTKTKGGYHEVSLYKNDITGAKNIVRFTEDFVT